MMSKSKLGQSLMRTIDGGKAKDDSTPNNVDNDAFEQARKNGPQYLNDEQPRASESLVDNTDEVITSGEPIAAPIRAKSEKDKYTNQKRGGGLISAGALLVALVALGMAGFAVMTQKAAQVAARNNFEDLDVAIGTLNSKVDDLTVGLAVTEKAAQSNTNKFSSIAVIRDDIQGLKTTTTVLSGKVDRTVSDLHSHGSSIDKFQERFNELENEIRKLKAKTAKSARVYDKVKPKTPEKKASTETSLLEGAYIASVDLWGTQTNVMLRSDDGSWVPLTVGDYYKGWRLEEAIGSETVFKKGSKTRKLRIKE